MLDIKNLDSGFNHVFHQDTFTNADGTYVVFIETTAEIADLVTYIRSLQAEGFVGFYVTAAGASKIITNAADMGTKIMVAFTDGTSAQLKYYEVEGRSFYGTFTA